MRKLTVLFLCTGNSCRSQMSEASLRDKYGDRFDGHSAGTDPKGVHPLTMRELEEIGIDTGPLRSKSVKEYLGRLWVHYLVIVCQQADESCPRIFPGMVQRLLWKFDDPPAFQGTETEKLEKFRQVRDEIAITIDDWVTQLVESGPVDTVQGGQVG